jgi:hypothetical protein
MAIQQMLLKSYGAAVVPWWGTRGLIMGGYVAGRNIDYITIASTGNASDFGDLGPSTHWDRYNSFGGGGGGRAIYAGGSYSSGTYATQDDAVYMTIASTGNGSAYGDLSRPIRESTGISNGTFLLVAGGNYPSGSGSGSYQTEIEYYTISTTNNASAWGDLHNGRQSGAGISDATRGLYGGGTGNSGESGPFTNMIQYLSVESTGDASDFGNLTVARGHFAGASDLTRGVFCGGYSPANEPAHGGYDKNTIDYVTIQSTGNATDFGDLVQPTQSPAGMQSDVRGAIGGGFQPETGMINYFTIQTTGNASDFGNMNNNTNSCVGASGS